MDRGEQGERGEGEAIQQSGRLSRTHQKGEEQGSCREEVPDIVVIKESQQDARPVLFPGLCWSLLGGQAEGQDLISTHTGPLLATLDPTGITLSLPSKQDPGKGAVLARPVARAGHENSVMLGPQNGSGTTTHISKGNPLVSASEVLHSTSCTASTRPPWSKPLISMEMDVTSC